jgi:hypothetical protein
MRIRRSLLHTAAGLGVAGVLVLGTAGATSSPVRASATGCTWAPNGDACMTVRGTGLHVDSARVWRGKTNSNFVCNYWSTVSVSGVSRVWRSNTHEGCTPGGASTEIPINADFADQSTICGRFFEKNEQQGGAVCETIHH